MGNADEQMLEFQRSIEDAVQFAEKSQEHISAYATAMPAAAFTTNVLWAKATWIATTFRWHPSSAAPPIMGLVFEDAEAARALFSAFIEKQTNTDEFDELRVSIVEGSPTGQRDAYSVHLSPDAECLAVHATGEGIVVDPSVLTLLSQWNRMYPVAGEPSMLPRFKEEFAMHQEYLLAPVTKREDGQLWVDVELGIIKKRIAFRKLSEIEVGDVDAGALVLPEVIVPGLDM